MDFQNYNDYMRTNFGFSGTGSQFGCCPNMNYQNMGIPSFSNQMCTDPYDLERMYPDSYRIIFPMVASACTNISMPINEDIICKMTDDIYDKVVLDSRISIETENTNDRQIDKDRRPRPHHRNRILNDFIRVLILRELLRRRHHGFPIF